MRDTVSHLAADPRGAARGAEPGAANASAAASARAFEQGNDFLVDLVRQVSAASQAATVRARSADVANDSGAEAQDGNAPGTLAGPHTPFALRSRAANATRPLAALGVWNASADNTTTEECVPGRLPAQALAACSLRWQDTRVAGLADLREMGVVALAAVCSQAHAFALGVPHPLSQERAGRPAKCVTVAWFLLTRAQQYVHGLQEARRGGGGPAALVGRLRGARHGL